MENIFRQELKIACHCLDGEAAQHQQ